MKLDGRLKTLAGAIASLFVVIGIIGYQGPPQNNRPTSVPTTEDSGAQGLEGIYRWLRESDLPARSLRHRYDALTDAESKYRVSGSSLLILSWPPRNPVRAGELEALSDFIRSGNHALIMVAGHDQPKWARPTSLWSDEEDLFDALDLDFSSNETVFLNNASIDEANNDEDGATDASDIPWANLKNHNREPLTLLSTSSQPVFGVAPELSTRRYPQARRGVTLTNTADSPRLWPVFVDNENSTTAMYRTERGSGTVWISLYPEIISNATLGNGDNSAFIAELISRTVADDGVVLFDDFHFGLSNIYDDEAFYRDSRLHRTLALLGALWLLWVAGRSTRLAPVRRNATRPSVKRLIKATGGLYARMLGRSEAASAILLHFQRDVQKRLRISDASDFWPALSAQLGDEHPAVEQLKTLARAIDSGRKPSLTKLSRAISDVRRDLA